MTHDVLAQAKALMDEFVEELAKVQLEEAFGLERPGAVRTPAPQEGDPEFRRRLLRNAPRVENDCIVAEKKSW